MQDSPQTGGQHFQWVQQTKGKWIWLLTKGQSTDEVAKFQIVKSLNGELILSQGILVMKLDGKGFTISRATDNATFGKTKGNLLELEDGRKYNWKKDKKSWLLMTTDKQPVITYHEDKKTDTGGQLQVALLDTADLPVLAAFLIFVSMRTKMQGGFLNGLLNAIGN